MKICRTLIENSIQPAAMMITGGAAVLIKTKSGDDTV